MRTLMTIIFSLALLIAQDYDEQYILIN